MKFAAFAERAEELEAEPGDLETVALVAELFADAGDDLDTLARFVQGRVFPAHDSTKLDVGPATCYEAIARAAGPNVSADDVEERLAAKGEIGTVAASYDFGGQRGLGAFAAGDSGDLTVAAVDAELRSIAAAEGEGSEDAKRDALFGLFNRSSPAEAKYLARLVLGEMRVGVGEGTVRDAVVEAFDVSTDAVERALQVTNDYGLVAETARAEGDGGLEALHLEVGRPVQAMLAQAGTVSDALESWDEVAVETKYDGARVQVHYDGAGALGIFSRNMEDVTDALPEVAESVEERVDVPVILDGEVVAIDECGEPLPFQAVLKRFRRKHEVARMREEVRVEFRPFDCLHADGEDLLGDPLTARHDRLHAVLDANVPGLLVTDDAAEIERIEAEALDAGHEGVMLKNPASTYSPGRRGQNWLKRKPDVETLDCAVVGAEWGEGRRANLFGTFLLGVRDGDEFETVGKVATGITDEELEELTELLKPYVREQDGQAVDVQPAVVFEVGYEEIQESPTYSSGYALRFPRFLGIRDDLEVADADTLERVRRLASS